MKTQERIKIIESTILLNDLDVLEQEKIKKLNDNDLIDYVLLNYLDIDDLLDELDEKNNYKSNTKKLQKIKSILFEKQLIKYILSFN